MGKRNSEFKDDYKIQSPENHLKIFLVHDFRRI